MTTFPGFRTGWAVASTVPEAAPPARPGWSRLTGIVDTVTGPGGPVEDAVARPSSPAPDGSLVVGPTGPVTDTSHADGKRSAGGGSGGVSLLGSAAGTAALWQLCACGHPLAIHDWEGAGCGSCPCPAWTLAALPGARPVQAGNQGHGDTGSGTAATGHTAG